MKKRHVVILMLLVAVFSVDARAFSGFTDLFNNMSYVNYTARSVVENGYVTIINDSNNYSEDETLLYVTFEDDDSIANPNISLGVGGNPYINVSNSNQTKSYNYDPLMLGWWKFNNSANDSSVKGNNGTIGSGVTYESNSYAFNGSGTITLNTYHQPLENLTIMAWVNINSSSSLKCILHHGGNMFQVSSDAVLNFWPDLSGNSVNWNTGTTLLNRGWTHVGVTFERYNSTSNKIVFYLDGINRSTQYTTSNLGTTTEGHYIGSYQGTQRFFVGKIDEVALYNKTMTSEEFNQQYENTLTYNLISTVNYTATGGHDGSGAAVFTTTSNVTFPAQDNFNINRGTVDFWVNKSNWQDGRDETILQFYGQNGNYLTIRKSAQNRLQANLYINGQTIYTKSYSTTSFTNSTWRNVRLAWNFEEEDYYTEFMVSTSQFQGDEDDSENFIPSDSTFDFNQNKSALSISTIFVGARNDGLEHFNGTLDDLRITDTEWSQYSYPTRPAVLVSQPINLSDIGNWTLFWNETIRDNTDIQIQLRYSLDGNTWTNWFSDDQKDNGFVVLTFDDGYDDNYNNAVPIMNSYNFSGVAYVEYTRIGLAGHMNLTELTEMKDVYGWEIGGHAAVEMTRPIINASAVWLQANGFENISMAWTGGDFDTATINASKDYFRFARSIIERPYMTNNHGYRNYEIDMGGEFTSVDRQKLSLLNSSKGWHVLNFHHVGNSSVEGNLNIEVENFTAVLDYLNSSTNLDVYTMKQVGVKLGLRTNNSGEMFDPRGMGFVQYKVLLFSYDGLNAPLLNDLGIEEYSETLETIVETSEVNTEPTESGGSYPSFWIRTYDNSQEEFSEVGQIDKSLTKRQRIGLKIDGAVHHLGVTEIGKDEVTIRIESNPQEAKLKVGDRKKFEVSGDEFYDISVYLKEIRYNYAYFELKYIQELKEPLRPAVEEKDETVSGAVEKKNDSSINYIGISVFAVIIVLMIFLIASKRKRSKFLIHRSYKRTRRFVF